MPHAYVNVKLHEPEARRYADMSGVLEDLRWVSCHCRRSIEEVERNGLKHLHELEPLHVAIVVRYGRCFTTGRRDDFRTEVLVERLTPKLRQAHRMFMDLRNKHYAHSVNDWELNVAGVQLKVDQETGEAEVTGINPSHGRVVSLATLQVEDLRDLADGLANMVDEEMRQEGARLLEFAKNIPIEELKRRMSDSPEIPGRRNPGEARRR